MKILSVLFALIICSGCTGLASRAIEAGGDAADAYEGYVRENVQFNLDAHSKEKLAIVKHCETVERIAHQNEAHCLISPTECVYEALADAFKRTAECWRKTRVPIFGLKEFRSRIGKVVPPEE